MNLQFKPLTNHKTKSNSIVELDSITAEDFAVKYKELKTTKAVAEYYCLNVKTVRKYLNKFNIKIKGRGYASQDFTYNPFENASQADKGYWVGYIAGDGYLTHNKNAVSIVSTDEEVILQFQDFVGDLLKIYKQVRVTKDIYLGRFSNKEGKEYLTRLGITTKKSLTLDLKVKMDWNIVRGLFDSDGNISKNGFKITTGSSFLKDKLILFFNSEGFSTRITIKGKYFDVFIKSDYKPMKEVISRLKDKLYPEDCKYYLKRKRDSMDALFSDK